MIRTLWQVTAVVCVLHVLAALGALGWLIGTDRLSRDRIERVAELLAPTVTEAEAQRQQEEQAEQEAADRARREAALSGAESRSIEQTLAAERRADEITLRRLERTRAEVQSLQQSLRNQQEQIDEARQALAEKEEALEQRLDQVEQRRNEEGFRKAVQLYESLPSDRVKEMFMNLMDDNETDQVVAYLEAMRSRQAAKVLEEFEGPNEVQRAVELTERLRQRGTELTANLEDAE